MGKFGIDKCDTCKGSGYEYTASKGINYYDYTKRCLECEGKGFVDNIDVDTEANEWF